MHLPLWANAVVLATWLLILGILVAAVALDAQSRSAPPSEARWRVKLGLPDDGHRYGIGQNIGLAVAAFAMATLLFAGTYGWLPTDVARGLNLAALFVGGGLRVISHGRSCNWKYVDHFGKILAYLGAFNTLMLIAQ